MNERFHRVLDEGQFEKGGLVFEVIEFLARHRRPGLEVHEVERLRQGDVVLRREVELARLAPLADDLVPGRVFADGRVRVGHVGDGQQGGVQFLLRLLLLLLQHTGLFAQRLALGDEFLFTGGVLLFRDEFGDLVLALLNALRLAGEAAASVVEVHDPVHVGFDAAVVAVGFDGVEMFSDEGGVEHEQIPSSPTIRRTGGTP